VPIQLLTTSREGQRGIAVYTLINEGSYIRNPILFQIRASAGLLVSGRTAMTLIMASDLTGSADRLDKAPSVILLRAAVQAFEEAAPDKDGAR
jgi:hypothetical protein